MKRKWGAVAASLVVVIGYVTGSIYSYAPQSEDVTADAAIVLGAAVWGERPSPVFRERINQAIKLYQAGSVEKIIFTGGHDDDGRIAESLVAKQYAQDRGGSKMIS